MVDGLHRNSCTLLNNLFPDDPDDRIEISDKALDLDAAGSRLEFGLLNWFGNCSYQAPVLDTV